VLKARVPQPPRCGTKTEGNKRQRGALLFGYFLLSKQKQSDSPEGEKEHCILSKNNTINITAIQVALSKDLLHFLSIIRTIY
jgi:hypothetical protein